MRIHNKKLTEALHVIGATLIGTSHGYDLFKISTWDAAQRFVLHTNTNRTAGQAYTRSENTFNSNINDSVKLYFFTLENTNQVIGACITGSGSSDIILYNNDGNNQIRLPNINILFENDNIDANFIPSTYNNIPLFLIPGINLPENEDGIFIQDHTLLGVCACLTENTHLEEINLSDKGILKVLSDAFAFGVKVNNVIVPTLTQDGRGLVLHSDAFNNVDNVLFSASKEEVDNFQIGNWGIGWRGNASIEYDSGITDEERQLRQTAKARQKADFITNEINQVLHEHAFSGDAFEYDKSQIWEIIDDLRYTLSKIEDLDDDVKVYIPTDVVDDLETLIHTYEKALFDLEVNWFERMVNDFIPDNLTLDHFENDKDIIYAIEQCLDWIVRISKDNTIFTQFRDQLPVDLIEKVKNSAKKWSELANEFEKIKVEREAHKLRYKVEGNHVVITGTRKGIEEIEIPETLEGKPVTIIGPYAFFGNKDLKEVKLPKTIKRIEKAAFEACDNLNLVSIKYFLKNIRNDHPIYVAPDAFNTFKF